MGNMSNFVKRVRDIMRNDAGINGDAQRIEQIAWMLFLKVYDAKEQDWEWDDRRYSLGFRKQYIVSNVEKSSSQCRYSNKKGYCADNIC